MTFRVKCTSKRTEQPGRSEWHAFILFSVHLDTALSSAPLASGAQPFVTTLSPWLVAPLAHHWWPSPPGRGVGQAGGAHCTGLRWHQRHTADENS